MSGNPFAAAMADEGDFYELENHEDENKLVENAYDPFQPIEEGTLSLHTDYF